MNPFNQTIETRESGKYYVSRTGRVVELDSETNLSKNVVTLQHILEKNDLLKEQNQELKKQIEQANAEYQNLEKRFNEGLDTPKTIEYVKELEAKINDLQKALNKENSHELLDEVKFGNLLNKNLMQTVTIIYKNTEGELTKENKELLEALNCQYIAPHVNETITTNDIDVVYFDTTDSLKDKVVKSVKACGVYSLDLQKYLIKPQVEVYRFIKK